VTLWGHQASSFSVDNICDENDNKPVVVLFVGCLAKRFKGIVLNTSKLQLHYLHLQTQYKCVTPNVGEAYLSATAACTWYFNPDIPEAQVYYSK
jgi:hypothetical protein